MFIDGDAALVLTKRGNRKNRETKTKAHPLRSDDYDVAKGARRLSLSLHVPCLLHRGTFLGWCHYSIWMALICRKTRPSIPQTAEKLQSAIHLIPTQLAAQRRYSRILFEMTPPKFPILIRMKRISRGEISENFPRDIPKCAIIQSTGKHKEMDAGIL